MLARGEDRGLGILTWEAHRHLEPDRTLLLDLGELARGFPSHPERYPGATRLQWDGSPLDSEQERQVRAWLEGLEVVYSAETFYDWRIMEWAREAGAATVLHVMPEFWRCGQDGVPMPDAVWVPTGWRRQLLPADSRLVPIPVALDRFAPHEPAEGPLRVLHDAGHRAAKDRNGTELVLRAAPLITRPAELTITTQDPRLPSINLRRSSPLTLRRELGGNGDYWTRYAHQDVLLMPRRYGGLSLPVQEALAAGLVPLLPDVEPNREWPAQLMPAGFSGQIATQGGALRMATVKPRDLAVAVDGLARDRGLLEELRAQGRAWSLEHSWEALGPLWRAELAAAR